MNDNEDRNEHEQAAKRTNEIVLLLIHFFQKFVEEKEIPEEQWSNVAPYLMFTWMGEQTLDRSQVTSEAGVPADSEAYDDVMAMINSRAAATEVLGIWPNVIFHKRALPSVPIDSMSIGLLISFADGTVLPITSLVTQTNTGGMPLSDKSLCMFLTKMISDMQHTFYSTSVDTLRRRHAVLTGGATGFNALGKTLQGGIATAYEPLRTFLKAWMVIIRQLSPHGLPPELMQAVAQAVSAAAQKEQAAEGQPPSSPPASGWDFLSPD